jgi:hypothetical protein
MMTKKFPVGVLDPPTGIIHDAQFSQQVSILAETHLAPIPSFEASQLRPKRLYTKTAR